MFYIIKKKIFKKLKEFKLNYSYVRFYNDDKSVVYINLNHRTKVRTYLNLFFRIREVYDQPVIIKFSVLRMILLAKWFKELDYIYFAKPFSRVSKTCVFGHSKKADFVVNFKYKNIYSSNEYKNALPYIMHPSNYLYPDNQLHSKSIGILMSGNFEKKIYDTKTIEDNFGLQNRWKIYSEVLKHRKLHSITGNELMQRLNSGEFKNKFVMMKWQTGAIPSQKWRYYLSSADFIFCAPGMTMPMCHNVIEAMSVGVIPILNYPHWLNPSLQNNFNCLVYESISDIESIINKALSLEIELKNEMVKNVINYYQDYYEKYHFENDGHAELIVLNEDIKDLI